jgi:hypothetical protein
MIDRADVAVGVIRVILTECPLLPVYPDERTSSARGSDFARRANQRGWLVKPVQPHLQKYFCFSEPQIRTIRFVIPSHTEGRFAIVTDVGRDAVDAAALKTRALDADGEVVWS